MVMIPPFFGSDLIHAASTVQKGVVALLSLKQNASANSSACGANKSACVKRYAFVQIVPHGVRMFPYMSHIICGSNISAFVATSHASDVLMISHEVRTVLHLIEQLRMYFCIVPDDW